LLKFFLCSKSRYKPKFTDCFNDPAFLKLFSEQLSLDTKRLNEARSGPNASSLQDGLATPPTDFTELPDNLDGSNHPVVGEGNIVFQDSTMEASHDNATAQAPAMLSASNMTPISQPKRSKKHKFYVLTRGRRTGVFDNW
jgi:hypothetical protein